MRWREQVLLSGGRELPQIRVSLMAFFRPLAIFLFSLLLFWGGTRLADMAGTVALVLSIIDAATVGALFFSTACWANGTQLFVRYGVVRPVYASVDAADIRGIGVDQSAAGRLLGYGSVVILARTAGIRMQFIHNPAAAADRIRESLQA